MFEPLRNNLLQQKQEISSVYYITNFGEVSIEILKFQHKRKISMAVKKAMIAVSNIIFSSLIDNL